MLLKVVDFDLQAAWAGKVIHVLNRDVAAACRGQPGVQRSGPSNAA